MIVGGSAKHAIIDSKFLLEFICKELVNNKKISSTLLPADYSINNPWEHFTKIVQVAKLIPSSLSHLANTRKGTYGIYRIPSSAFYYETIDALLDEAFTHSKSYDVISHLLQPRYRSHYVHSFLVGALGWWMLHNVKFKGNYLHECYVESIKKRYSGQGYDLWDIWWSIATLHDVGYPVSLFLRRIELLCSFSYNYPALGTAHSSHVPDQVILSGIIESLLLSSFKGKLSESLIELTMLFLNKMKSKSSLSSFNFKELKGELFKAVYQAVITCLEEIAESFIRDDGGSSRESFKSKLLKYKASGRPAEKIRKFVCQFDHGVMSAIIASQFIGETARWKDDPIPDLIFSPIVFHGLKSVGRGEKITCEITDDFDIFFLRLVDEMQEWNRSILSDKREEILIESERIEIGPFKGAHQYIDLEKMEIGFEMNNIDALLKTGWSFKEFLNAKKSSFKLLELAGHKFKPKLKLGII